jgi:hypothetical protein
MTKTETEKAIYQEWGNMYHNASIGRYFPSFQNDYEYELFWEWLSDDVSCCIQYLQEEIKETFGYSWTFYQYGRQGATIAPEDIMRAVGGDSFGGLKDDAIPENYQSMRKFLRALQYINQYWKDTVKYLPERWQEDKEANDYQEDIDAHDGMHKIMVEKWVKEVAK